MFSSRDSFGLQISIHFQHQTNLIQDFKGQLNLRIQFNNLKPRRVFDVASDDGMYVFTFGEWLNRRTQVFHRIETTYFPAGKAKTDVAAMLNFYHGTFVVGAAFVNQQKAVVAVFVMGDNFTGALVVIFGTFFANAGAVTLLDFILETRTFSLVKSAQLLAKMVFLDKRKKVFFGRH